VLKLAPLGLAQDHLVGAATRHRHTNLPPPPFPKRDGTYGRKDYAGECLGHMLCTGRREQVIATAKLRRPRVAPALLAGSKASPSLSVWRLSSTALLRPLAAGHSQIGGDCKRRRPSKGDFATSTSGCGGDGRRVRTSASCVLILGVDAVPE
jgi:hypothetical protein